MLPYKDQPKVDILYTLFSDQPYRPATYWTTNRGFELDLLYQSDTIHYVPDPVLETRQHEFVLDTTLVPPL